MGENFHFGLLVGKNYGGGGKRQAGPELKVWEVVHPNPSDGKSYGIYIMLSLLGENSTSAMRISNIC